MKRIFFLIFMLTAALAQPTLAGHAANRVSQSLDKAWVFTRSDPADGAAVKADMTDWQTINLPHSFDNTDPDADGKYYRGPAWYRHVLTVAHIAPGERRYIEFDGAALATDLWVNGQRVGRHEGGFARFRFDLTPYLKPGANLLAVRVDNSRSESVLPLSGDFTLFGGIYRSVRLITTPAVHFDMLDYGGPGVYLAQSQVTAQSANLQWTAGVANDSDMSQPVTVAVRLYDAHHSLAQTIVQTADAPAHAVSPVTLTAILDNPHLWHGVNDPYLYTAEVTLVAGTAQDGVSLPIGLRDIRLDPDRGLFLNGRSYNVHGVNLHQSMRPGVGPAVSDAAVDEDFEILADLGVTGLRLAHYQHDQRDYDLSDRAGYLVWTEMPLVSEANGSPEFLVDATQQLRELIRQNSNHPSVMVWGLGNEIYKSDDDSNRVLDVLQTVAREEDPSRPTVYANCCGPVTQPHASHTDALGSNVYFGWYSGDFSDLAGWGATSHASRPTTPLSLSEYGAGASILHQEDPPVRPKPGSRWHPEQYQALYHEAAWRQIRDDMSYLWGTFVWVGFDFPSAGRNEGDRAGINDKGLVTFDRKVKKDSFFWYQANWSSNPMVYITSRRDTVRSQASVTVKIYSNQSVAHLTLNGADLGEKPVDDHVAVWQVDLAPGRNSIKVTAGTSASDHVEWIYQPRIATP